MEWSQKRKILYALSFAGVVILLAAYPTYQLINKAPTCFDQKQNGTETGVDCGGGCALVCASDVKPPHAVWAKVFPINGQTYDIGAYVENTNVNAGVKSARYTIRVLDGAGQTLVEKKGATELTPESRVLLFETGVTFPGTPDRVELSFDTADLTRWTKATTAPSPVVTKNQIFKNADTKPRFDAVLVNTDSVNEVTNLTLSAIIYDTQRNPTAVSKTFVDRIAKGGEQNIFFTWPSRITKHARGEMCTIPVDTMIVLDRSGSMDVGHKNPPEPLETAKNVAKLYTGLVGVVDKVGLVSFADTPSNPIDHELSSDKNSTETSLSAIAIKKGGLQNTNLGDALKVAIAELQSIRHTVGTKQAIIAITDGNTARPVGPMVSKNKQYAEDYAAGIAEDARKSAIGIYAIGIGKSINEAFLRDRIGGDTTHYFSTSTPETLQTIYKNVSGIVCPQENFITEIVVTPRAIFAE